MEVAQHVGPRRGGWSVTPLALGLLLIVGLVASSSTIPGGSPRPTASAGLRGASLEPSGNCSTNGLARLAIDPPTARVLPLANDVFWASATNACGSPVGPGVAYTWSLSSIELGALNTTTGPTVAYSACLAPMDGALHLRASDGPVTLFSNSTVSVTGQGSAGSSPAPAGSSNSSGGTENPTVHLSATEGALAVAAIFALAGVVLAFGLRKRP